MSELVHSLQQQFPCEQTPFGNCVIVPSKSFKPEWERQLKAEGFKVFSQSWNGESSFFVRLEHSKFRKRWSSREEGQLKEFVSQGLSHADIAEKLGRTKISVQGKIQRLKLNSHMQPASKPESAELSHDVVKEFLSACSLLYPSHKTACAFLLREASNKVLEEAE